MENVPNTRGCVSTQEHGISEDTQIDYIDYHPMDEILCLACIRWRYPRNYVITESVSRGQFNTTVLAHDEIDDPSRVFVLRSNLTEHHLLTSLKTFRLQSVYSNG